MILDLAYDTTTLQMKMKTKTIVIAKMKLMMKLMTMKMKMKMTKMTMRTAKRAHDRKECASVRGRTAHCLTAATIALLEVCFSFSR
jgi:hypothetical protein